MHATVTVILPKHEPDADIDALVEHLMDPFNEQKHETLSYTESDGETYHTNPNGKWDWYEIGGRWQDELCDGDICTVRQITATDPFFAILTPNGQWYERQTFVYDYTAHNGELSTKDEQQWRAEYFETLSAYPTHTAVLVDYHY